MKAFGRHLLMAAAVVSMTPFLLGATYYVDVNHGSCNNSPSCGAENTPCCTLAAADTISGLTRGDTVLVKAGRYTGEYDFSNRCLSSSSFNGYANLSTSGVTWSAYGTDRVTIDLEGQQHAGLCITGDDVTITAGNGTFEIVNKAQASGTTRSACLESRSADNITVRGLHCEVNDYGSASNGLQVCYSFRSGGNGVLLEDSTCTGAITLGVYLWDTMQSSNSAPGAVIRNNTFTYTNTYSGSSWTATGMVIKDTGNNNNTESILVYNNLLDYTGAGSLQKRAFYLRNDGAPMYIFNNRALNIDRGFYLQDNQHLSQNPIWPEEKLYVFNNTLTSDGSPMEGVSWTNTYRANFKNNIFYNFGTCLDMRPPYCDSAYCPHTDSVVDSTDDFSHNVCYRPGSTPRIINESDQSFQGTSTGNSTANPYLDLATGTVTSASGSGVGAGTPDPEEAGNGETCTLGANGISVPCSIDFEGDSHGQTWDKGVDQFADAVSGVPPGTTPNVSRGDTKD